MGTCPNVWTHSRHLAALGYWETSFHSRLCHCFASLGIRQIALRSKWHLSTAQYRDLWAEKRPAVWWSVKNLISCRSARKGIKCGEQRVKAELMSGMRRECCLFGLSLPPFAKCSQAHLTLQNITAIVAPWGDLVKTQDTAYMLYIMIMKMFMNEMNVCFCSGGPIRLDMKLYFLLWRHSRSRSHLSRLKLFRNRTLQEQRLF